MPTPLQDLARTSAAELKIGGVNIHRDYWLTRCLHALAVRTGGSGLLFAGDRNPHLREGVCAFTGGTALVTAWGITNRYSQDLDLLGLMDMEAHAGAMRRWHTAIADTAKTACGYRDHEHVASEDSAHPSFQQMTVRAGFPPAPLLIDSSIEAFDDSLFAKRAITSLMGRFASEGQKEQFPELGGFELPCIVPAYIVVNKFDALHRRSRKPHAVQMRGRDLFDIAAVSLSPHAEEVSRRIPELASRASDSPIRSVVVRPSGGYGHSPVFVKGTAAYEALRSGYELATHTSWDRPLPFEEAVRLAVALDSH